MDYEKFNEETDDPVSYAGGYLGGKHTALGWSPNDLPFGENPGRHEQFLRMQAAFNKGFSHGRSVRGGLVEAPPWDDAENEEMVALIVEDKLDPQGLASRLLRAAAKAHKMPAILKEEGHTEEAVIRMCDEWDRRAAQNPQPAFVKQMPIENPFKQFKEEVSDALPFMVGYICGASTRESLFIQKNEPVDEQGKKILADLQAGHKLGLAVKNGEKKKPEWHNSAVEVALLLTNLNALSNSSDIRDFFHPMAQETPHLHNCETHQPKKQQEEKKTDEENGQNMPSNGGWRN